MQPKPYAIQVFAVFSHKLLGHLASIKVEMTQLSQIIPSQMEVAPLHRTVDIRQKRRLLKNTKETKKILEG